MLMWLTKSDLLAARLSSCDTTSLGLQLQVITVENEQGTDVLKAATFVRVFSL